MSVLAPGCPLRPLLYVDVHQRIGGTGTGKTHLATALGVKAITQHGKGVRFFSTVDLVNSLELEKAAGRQGRLAYSLMHVDLVVLDELALTGRNKERPASNALAVAPVGRRRACGVSSRFAAPGRR